MTLDDIKALVVAVDPNAGHYESAYQGSPAYTVWFEVRALPDMGDNAHQGAIAFQIDRFTKTEGDAIASALFAALEADDRVAFSYAVDFEPDTRYIHHIFDCQGV